MAKVLMDDTKVLMVGNKVLVTGAAPTTSETWLINETPTPGDWKNLAVSFTSNGTNYTRISMSNTTVAVNISYETTMVYNAKGSGWANVAYRTVILPNGIAVLDNDLKAWFQANAVKQN